MRDRRAAANVPTAMQAQKQRPRGLSLNDQKNLLDKDKIEAENKIMQNKLKAITREPPRSFHAPNGQMSLKKYAAAINAPKRNATAWPTQIAAPGGKKKRDEAARIAADNAVLQRKMREQYKKNRESELVRTGKGLPVDGLEMWAKRLTLYDDPQPPLVNRTNVPQDLCCAICSGCGRKSYYMADGLPLKRHPDLKDVFYCSATCMEVDEVSKRNAVEYATKGVWRVARPANESWIVNKSMAAERRLLRRNADAPRPRTAEEIFAVSARVRKAERVEEQQLKQRFDAANQPGYDGERPCCWEGPTY